MVEVKSLPRPAYVYCHGGGGFALDAQSHHTYCSRIAEDNDVIVFNINYRLAPEYPTPAGIMDAYASLKYVHENASELNVDPERIAIVGASGGCVMAVGCCIKLALRNESDIVKLASFEIPMTGDLYVRNNYEGMKNETERNCFQIHRMVAALLMGKYKRSDCKDALGNINVFPNLMEDDVAARFPKSIVWTGEFDSERRNAEELAEKL